MKLPPARPRIFRRHVLLVACWFAAANPAFADEINPPSEDTELREVAYGKEASNAGTPADEEDAQSQFEWLSTVDSSGNPAFGASPRSVDVSSDGTVSNLFYNTPLRDALNEVAAQTGEVIVVDPAVEGLVTADFKNVPLDEALEILLAGTGYILQRREGYYLVAATDPETPSFQEISHIRHLRLNYVKAEEVNALLPPSLRSYVQAAPESNRISIMAPAPILQRIERAIHDLDVAPVQLMLDARIVILENNDLSNIGINWRFPSLEAGGYTDSDLQDAENVHKWPWAVEFGYTPGGEFTNSLLLTLNLLEQNDQAAVIASPRVMAQNGEQAIIQVTSEEYFEILTQGFYTNSELEKIETGTTLSITPWVGDGDRISMELQVEVSDVVARGSGNLPVVNRRVAQNRVWVEDGGTAAIAGLTDSRLRQNDQAVPNVHRIPWLGRLFESNTEQDTSRQVAVFVTPRIIDSDPAASLRPADPPRIPPVGPEFRRQLEESLAKFNGRFAAAPGRYVP